MEDKNVKQPLLYIEQPHIEETKAFMQDSYSSINKPKAANMDVESVQREVSDHGMRRRSNPFFDVFEYDEKPEPHDEDEREEKDNEQEEQLNDDVIFKDLTIQEKINYFTQLPAEMPRIKCELHLENDVFKGVIVEDNDKEVIMQTGRATREIKKEDIIEINLLGF